MLTFLLIILLSICYYIGMAYIMVIINEWFSYINILNSE